MTKFHLLQFDTTNFWVLNWYYVVAVLLSASALVLGIKNYRKKKSKETDNPVIPNFNNSSSLTNTNHSPISIINNVGTTEVKTNPVASPLPPDEKSKLNVKILFIDDNHTDYKMVSILKKAGWTNTKAVKDIVDLDNHIILESDIIFVDINGVGTTMFEDQGLGLASALKSKHPKKKVVIYSAETTGDRFHKVLRQVDDCLAKNAEPYQFIDLVESLSKTI